MDGLMIWGKKWLKMCYKQFFKHIECCVSLEEKGKKG